MDTINITEAEVLALSHELYEIVTTNWDEIGPNDNLLLDEPRVRQIGEQLNRADGYMAMQTCMNAISAAFEADGFFDLLQLFRTEINWAWNGIGEWQA